VLTHNFGLGFAFVSFNVRPTVAMSALSYRCDVCLNLSLVVRAMSSLRLFLGPELSRVRVWPKHERESFALMLGQASKMRRAWGISPPRGDER
jgi:hypothetical protein